MSYEELGDFARAESYFFKALKIDEETGNKNNLARHYANLGNLSVKQKRLKEAGDLFRRSMALAKEFGSMELMRDNFHNLVNIDTLTGNFKAALEHYKNFITYRDSLQNEESTRKQTQLEMQYEFDKKQTADSIRNAEVLKQENLKHDQEIEQQKIYTYGGIAGFILMLVIAGVSFRAFRQKQKANGIISHQKLLVEEKQREILDSIHYAKRIQESLLPSERYISKKLQELKK
jgi:tetratricopeptide (TPR) repeat protein